MNQHATPGGDVKPGPGRNGSEPGWEAGGRSHTHELLAERLRFETFLARLSATFVNLPAGEVDGHIERGLRQVVEFLGVERSSLAQFSDDGNQLLVTHSYTAPGFD